uniref:Uncharacterized protein LOC111114848 isoform X2 n=1 Tax=Crassostrea virginica TaxID=6565 RepID=A0A8B8C093_CRAVI|nr:uncharacterized protein LOC111114848 isoform X2 [Crassostrea virginica]
MWWPLLPSDRKRPLLLILQWLSLKTVEAAYVPNFGLVGCYRYKDNMDKFNSSKFVKISYNVGDNSKTRFLHCVQGCLKNNTQFRYAGLMKSESGYKCFCGENYNQTFAVDLNECLACPKCMKIYNTDYDIKPLLSIPGNGPKLVKIWNSSDEPFMNDVMRNPAIDWWNEKKLYHEPEYNICCCSTKKNYTTSFHKLSSEDISTFTIIKTSSSKICKRCHSTDRIERGTLCHTRNSYNNGNCNGLNGKGGNVYSALEEQHKKEFPDEGEYICGLVLNCSRPSSEQCKIDIMRDKKIVTSINVKQQPCSPFLLDKCVWATKIIILNNCACKCDISVYRQKDNVLAVVDRLVVLGFYHKEEPKVSKWEFLNDFPSEEVLNIMRPHLEKVRHEGAVPVRNLSSRARTKQSANDERTSSRGIGIIGGCLLGFVILIIFISDILIIKVHLTALFRNLYSFCHR